MTKIFILFALLIQTESYCQENDTIKIDNSHFISLFPELAGNGGLFSMSLEYMYQFNNGSNGVYLRYGAGDCWDCLNKFIESGFLLGKRKNFIDAGLGYSRFYVYNGGYIGEYFYSLRLGYRYQGKKGFLFKVAPMLVRKFEPDGSQNSFWFGIGMGYSLKLKK